MKKIFTFLILLIAPLLFALPVLAKETKEHVVLDANEVVDKDYFAAGEAVTILGTVNGDAYLAGGNINIEGTINGDLIVAGGNVNVRGTVTGDIRAAGGTININGTVGKNVTALGGNATLSPNALVGGSVVLVGGNLSVDSPIGRGATLAGGQITLSNSVGGDVWAGVGSLSLTNNANVDGNLHYVSDQDAVIASGAVISGETRRDQPPQPSEEQQAAGRAAAKGLGFGFKLFSLLSSLLIGFILLRFVPRFMESTTDTIRKNPWRALGFGFLTYAVFPFAFIVLLLTVVGIPLALFLLFGILLLACLSKIFVALFVGNWIMNRFNWKGGLLSQLFVGLIVYMLLSFVPVVDGLTFLAFLLIGTGALLLTKKQYYDQLRKKDIL